MLPASSRGEPPRRYARFYRRQAHVPFSSRAAEALAIVLDSGIGDQASHFDTQRICDDF